MTAYGSGVDPLGFAESLVTEIVLMHSVVAQARAEDPAAFAAYGPGLSPVTLARRILGELLDAGWEPPRIFRRDE